ncbi:ImmA/IrrE family metallo-endopeptidase [Desulfuromonas thiophila]|uniref:ImmA/IrrE family metallo-endopeptidase n=1 Tax=Desulfuromonas thiophila TaxID=57664 RepID=UPI0024A86CF2|nr:ImmA/IrrE family metallo-endopeptidase [Desulfuromonas thiophila]
MRTETEHLATRLEDLIERTTVLAQQPPEFFQRLDFIKQSRYLAPYNAFLVAQQRPDATLVFSEAEWIKRGRFALPQAMPMVVLKPFGPVEFVYDIKDTDGEPLEGYDPNLPIGAVCDRIFPYEGVLGPELALLFHRLIFNCPKKQIKVFIIPDEPTRAGHVRCYRVPEKDGRSYREHFELFLNANHHIEQQLPALVHELAHIFCGHLSETGQKKPLHRRELEAEAVAYLYCYRNGFRPCSEEYLLDYYERGINPPVALFEGILKAHREIDQLVTADEKDEDFRPEVLHFFIGGFMGSSCELLFENGKLLHRSFSHQYTLEKETVVEVKKDGWAKFLKACHAAAIWEWEKHYEEPDVCDGCHWHLYVKLPYAEVESSGDNAYPHGFERLLTAAKRLANGLEFS